ncbi:MAG: hypothetical protein GY844_02870 [Bradyrhizobium sp.]|nr:hypothetical protein [Bradyrhizobium sp.]
MIETPHDILEGSLRIALDYLEGTGELGERDTAVRFLRDNIGAAMNRGEFRKLLLSNRAIDAYRRRQTTREFALVS